MQMSVEHERLVRMIKESISLMCKSSLNYELELNVEGLLGITLDKKDVFLVNINESFQTNAQTEQLEREIREVKQAKTLQKRHHDCDTDIKEEGEGSAHSPTSSAKRKRARHRSRDSQGVADTESVAPTSQHSLAHGPHAETSRDSVHLGSSVESQSSGDPAVKEESSDIEFGDFVIKQEVSDVDENVEGGYEDSDLYFTGESFKGKPPNQMGMLGPSGTGAIMRQMMSASVEGDGCQPGYVPSQFGASGFYGADVPDTGAGHYPCHYCGKRFKTKGGLQQHLRYHTRQTFDCRICSKKFAIKAHLTRHVQAVHENVKFTCKFCSKIFCYRDDVQRHQKHSCTVRPFPV